MMRVGLLQVSRIVLMMIPPHRQTHLSRYEWLTGIAANQRRPVKVKVRETKRNTNPEEKTRT